MSERICLFCVILCLLCTSAYFKEAQRAPGWLVLRNETDPVVFRNGTKSTIILDCDYKYEDKIYKNDGMVIKWYFNNSHTPVYQWIPFSGKEPQASGVLEQRVDPHYRVTDDDATMHRALQIHNPTTELSGDYKCIVSTFHGDYSQTTRMVVFVPEESLSVTHAKDNDNTVVNVTCSAKGVYPEPELHIVSESRNVTYTAEVSTLKREDGLYDTTASVQLKNSSLPTSPTQLVCELRLPDANYTRSAFTDYYPGPPTTTSIPDVIDYSSTTSTYEGLQKSEMFDDGSMLRFNAFSLIASLLTCFLFYTL